MSLLTSLSETVGVVEVHDDEGALLTVLHPTADVIQIVTPELIGPRGPQGPQGARGFPGSVGSTGDTGDTGPFAPTFEMQFASPALKWIIAHGLDVYPMVSIYDLNGSEISGDVSMPDRNTVIVDFVVPIAGTAIVKA